MLSFANIGSGYKLLCCNAFITVVESAELWNGNDLSVVQRLSRKRTLLTEAQMGSRIMVVAEIIRQRSFEMARIQNDVVVQTLASNRADLIDPAILRPGRIDRKIKVNRPDKQGAREIYRIYLTDSLPYDGVLAKEADGLGASIERLIERFVDWQFAHRDENRFLEVTLRSGRKETLYRSDLISGAIIASIIERAKATAIKRAIATQQEEGIRETDLQLAFNAEYIENDIFPTTDITEDWLKLIDYDPENVVKISPIRPRDESAKRSSGVI